MEGPVVAREDQLEEGMGHESDISAESLPPDEEPQERTPTSSTKPSRFIPLDVFRGLSMCFMIWDLEHAAWHGFNPADLIFPSFLFAVGNSLGFTENKFNKMSALQVFMSILKRSFILFLLGYLIYWFPFVGYSDGIGWEMKPLAETRVFGVLQRIAMCYFVAALMVRKFNNVALVGISVATLVAYWAILWLFATHSQGDPYSEQNNPVLKLDLWLIGPKHLYIDDGFRFDPEGLLSTVPAVVNVIAGHIAWSYIKGKLNDYSALGKVVGCGIALIALGLAWNIYLPINKKIWTSSFVCLTIGIDLLIFVFLISVDQFVIARDARCNIFVTILKKFFSAIYWFFTIFGQNPLFIYLFCNLLQNLLQTIPSGRPQMSIFQFVQVFVFQELFPASIEHFVFSLVWVLFNWTVGFTMHKLGIYVRV